MYSNENLTMPESLGYIIHFFLGDLIASFHLITLRINCGQMYSNNRLIYKEQEAFLAVPGEIQHFDCNSALQLSCFFQPLSHVCHLTCLGIKKCHGMHCLHTSISTQFLAGVKIACLNPGHIGSYFFPNQVINA